VSISSWVSGLKDEVDEISGSDEGIDIELGSTVTDEEGSTKADGSDSSAAVGASESWGEYGGVEVEAGISGGNSKGAGAGGEGEDIEAVGRARSGGIARTRSSKVSFIVNKRVDALGTKRVRTVRDL
jgi:hypothetical protein